MTEKSLIRQIELKRDFDDDKYKVIPNYREFLKSKQELSDEEKIAVDEAVSKFMDAWKSNGDQVLNESIFGSILGGLTGFALGSSIGRIFANILGIEKGILYDLLTSRLVAAAIGSSIGKKVI